MIRMKRFLYLLLTGFLLYTPAWSILAMEREKQDVSSSTAMELEASTDSFAAAAPPEKQDVSSLASRQ